MLESMLNTTSMKYLEKGLNAAWVRNEVIADNIANIDTPGFTASHVEFEDILKSALDDSAFSARKTSNRHFDFGAMDWEQVQPVILENPDTDMRMDGNNVDMETEMLELSRNTLHYNSMVSKLSSEFSRMRTAITG